MAKSRKSHGSNRSAHWRQERDHTAHSRDQWYITGLNGVRACLRSKAIRILKVWAQPEKVPTELHEELARLGSIVTRTKDRESSRGPILQGLGALVSPPEWPDVETLIQERIDEGRKPLLVALDQVEDPQNLGQILRTCESAGVDAVLVPKHRSAGLNETVARVSQGAFAWLPAIEVINLRQTLDRLKALGLWVVGCQLDPSSKPWHRVDFTDPTVLVMGAEGKGLRDLTRKTCDHLAYLSMFGKTESLNVGAATAAFLYEAVRQRSAKTE